MSDNRFVRGLLAGFLLSAVLIIGALLGANSLSSDTDEGTPIPDTPTSPAMPPAASPTPALDWAQTNEQTLQRLVDDVLNDSNTEILDEIFAPGYVGHLPASETSWPGLTADSYRELAILLHNAIPDVRVTPEIVVNSGEWVAMRAVLRGTFESEFYDFSPTRQPVEIVFTVLYRFDTTGRIAEEWIEYDTLAFAQQFGGAGSAAADD